jgi:hypothetical protein
MGSYLLSNVASSRSNKIKKHYEKTIIIAAVFFISCGAILHAHE